MLSPKFNARLAGVPTLAEAGVAGIALVSFGGISVPRGTPAAVVNQIRDALGKALAMPEVRAQLEASGTTVLPGTPEEFSEALRGEITLTEKLMKAAKIDPQ